jgi:hypothetical protein
MNTTTIVGMLLLGGVVTYVIIRRPAGGNTIPEGELPDCGINLVYN